MIWSKNANAWERGAAYARAFHRRHGHLAIPAAVKLDDYTVGAWMSRRRKADNLNPDQMAKLDAWTSCGAWSRTGTAPAAVCSSTSPPAAPSMARRTVPAARRTRPSGPARGCESRTRPTPRGGRPTGRPRSWMLSTGTPRPPSADLPRRPPSAPPPVRAHPGRDGRPYPVPTPGGTAR
ncbi:helicase associated domain-containing protein [Kitasatospora sp. NPDC056531]|uniref:helicase associated domain-containing protein n=1 Tax=Kitasatospora sp. NPDC056531 TaxID=3345856 RepID=UPI0036C24DFC